MPSEVRGGDKFRANLSELRGKLARGEGLKVGFLEKATYPDGTSVALVAAVQNFGAPSRGIPPRPFFSNMVAAKSHEWGPALQGLLQANNFDVDKSLRLLGEGIAGQLRQSIADTNTPALKPETARRKGFEKPLVATGHMLASVDYEVTK